MGGGDEPLERASGDRPQLEPVGDAETELDDRRAERNASSVAVIAAQIPAPGDGLNESMRAAARNAEPAADLRDGQAVGLRREQLEDVEYAVSGLDGRGRHRHRSHICEQQFM